MLHWSSPSYVVAVVVGWGFRLALPAMFSKQLAATIARQGTNICCFTTAGSVMTQ